MRYKSANRSTKARLDIKVRGYVDQSMFQCLLCLNVEERLCFDQSIFEASLARCL